MHPEYAYKALIVASISIAYIFSICFILLKVPKKESLRSYRISRKVMSFAYFVFGTLNVIELYYISDEPDISFSSLVTLIVAAFQAILFTFTLLTLIDLDFISKRKIFRELLPVSLFAITAFILYFADFSHIYKILYYIFTLYYISLIIRFSFTFFKSYRAYVQKIYNYFSIQEANRLRWVRTAYFATITIGVVALLSLYLNEAFAILFNILYVSFFVYFGIRFINYIFIFQEIETAIVSSDTKGVKGERESSYSFNQLEQAINEWEQKKRYTESGITIEQVAGEIKTNRTYLSTYINTYKRMTFNEWINDLRIEEAKRMLISNPELPVGQIGVMIGLPDKSNFGRQFSKKTGSSPLAWRISQLV